jgi:8-oxo-dGTP diphosphatase
VHPAPEHKPTIVVTAAVIERAGAYLVTRRPRGTHLEGYWEFPGGKCDPGETLEACLLREIQEELGVVVRVGAEVYAVTHEYPERVVQLHFYACELAGEPQPLLGQEMCWVPRGELRALEFPPADAELLATLTGQRETPA